LIHSSGTFRFSLAMSTRYNFAHNFAHNFAVKIFSLEIAIATEPGISCHVSVC
jgi:hypothetical protein